MDEEDNLTVAPSEAEGAVTEVMTDTKELPTGKELEYIGIKLDNRDRLLEFVIFRDDQNRIVPYCSGGRLLEYLRRKGVDIKGTKYLDQLMGYRMKFIEKEDKRGYRNWVPDWEHDPQKDMPEEASAPEQQAASSEPSGDSKALYNFIAEKGDAGCTEVECLRHVKNNRPKLDKLLNALMDEGRVYEKEEGTFAALVT